MFNKMENMCINMSKRQIDTALKQPQKEMKDLEVLKSRLEAASLEFVAQAGEEGKLFGSVTAQQLAERLAEQGLNLDRRKINLDEPIRSLGEHQVTVRLRGDLTAELKVTVAAAD